jgi:lipoic acid synthetase
MARELPIFSPPDTGHGHDAELPSIALGGGPAGLPAVDGSTALRRHPDWIRARMPSGESYHELKGLLRGLSLNTVCEEARCPNIGECWDQRTATIMILGDTCTRACGFCAVKTGRPTWFDDDEPRRVAEAVGALGLEHVVVTSVARDDLPDGGARIFAETIERMRGTSPGMGIEVLIPDFDGADERLRTVMDARPDILNHNLETVRRLQKPVRRRARWDRSLYVLRRAKEMAHEIGYPAHTKSSLMVGLGETRDELTEAFDALREVDVDILTIGQYLRPSMQHLPLERYYHPDEFAEMKVEALALGFRHVESAPLVRSSYHARDQVPGAELKRLRRQATIDTEGRIGEARLRVGDARGSRSRGGDERDLLHGVASAIRPPAGVSRGGSGRVVHAGRSTGEDFEGPGAVPRRASAAGRALGQQVAHRHAGGGDRQQRDGLGRPDDRARPIAPAIGGGRVGHRIAIHLDDAIDQIDDPVDGNQRAGVQSLLPFLVVLQCGT